ncbi:TorD/DmsD family molecular chaperone [Cognatazoarcus halotolerans]|uniref:TorD/DmsD family molecular chaperone n=1 Tax=Cognatazoarcus halotolerans TaxID=2686016 RepID=UPI00135759AD|nr:molecular chaperone TorD family protein [Cognatazoarcus halotolerans]MCB1899387.1 molecular chaperone TorD family protein [Rhodocyclaceae bacterium]MCP5310349.1 molecular chaperone TorD family protein [Zoogloeaceae bacterium]
MTTLETRAAPVSPEDEDRAGFYGLIANLLAQPPHPVLLASLAGAEPLEPEAGIAEAEALARAWKGLRAAARDGDSAAIADEWRALFTAPGKPQAVMHASWYLTGFMMEKPLAVLRDDLATLGLARRDSCGEPEDHLAALCDVMRALLIDVRRPPAERAAAQENFFNRHLRPWAAACCTALQNAEDARFYKSVGAFSGAFLALEMRMLEIEA